MGISWWRSLGAILNCLLLGGDVWVLAIKDAKLDDTGLYVCEVNSVPVVRSFYKLSGKSCWIY